MENTQETPRSEQEGTSSVRESVDKVKQRIIATGKLMKYLKNAKKDLDDKNSEIDTLKSGLTTSIETMRAMVDKNKNQLTEIEKLNRQVKTLQTQISDNNSTAESTVNIQELKEQLTAMENERNEKDRLVQSKQSYIQQLEAQCEILRESSNQQIEKAKSSGKQSSELKKKKEEIAALKERLSLTEKKVESLTADLHRVQEEKESLDEDIIEMKMNNDMVEGELDDLKESLRDMVPKLEFEKYQSDYNDAKKELKKCQIDYNSMKKELEKCHISYKNTISALKNQIDAPKTQDFNKQIAVKDHEITKLKEENSQLKSKNLHTSQQKVSPQSVNQDLVKRFYKMRGECIYYQRESKRLKEQLKELCMQEALSHGLDDVEVVPNSPIDTDLFEDDSIFRVERSPSIQSSPPPKSISPLTKPREILSTSPKPRSMASLTRSSKTLSISTSSQPKSMASLAKSGETSPLSVSSRFSSTSPSPIETLSPTSDKSLLRKSGLIPPPPKVNTTSAVRRKSIPAGKNKNSRLMKFVNARNSEKMLNSKPLPVPITPTASTLKASTSLSATTSTPQTLPKVTSAQQSSRVSSPATEKPMISPMKRSTSQAQISGSPNDMENITKKPKPAPIHPSIALMETHLKAGTMPNLEGIKSHLTDFLDEIDEMYATMNSPAEPVSKVLMKIGHPNVLQMDLPQGMVQREKLCILLVCLLAKHDRSDYDTLMKGVFSRLLTCVNDKVINNKLIRYVRLVAAVGNFNHQPELVRLCIYSIIKSKNKDSNAIAALLNVSYIYKDCLCNPAFSSLQEAENVLFYNTLQACIAHIKRTYDTHSDAKQVKHMYDKLIEETGWSSTVTIDDCLNNAISILDAPKFLEIYQKPEDYKQVRQSIVMSIELCHLVKYDWKTTYDVFIRGKLWPLLVKPVVNDIAIELLGKLASSIGVYRGSSKIPGTAVDVLLKTLAQIVRLSDSLPKDENYIQHTAAAAILEIVGHDHDSEYRNIAINFYMDKNRK